MIDLLLLIVALISFIVGWRSGLLKTIFKFLGFVGGGLIGLIIAIKVLTGVTNIFGKFAMFILFISIGSTLGEWLLNRFAKFFHNAILLPPLKWIDSLLGAALSILRIAVVIYLVFSLMIAAHWQTPSRYINESQLYAKSKVLVPRLVKNLTSKVKY